MKRYNCPDCSMSDGGVIDICSLCKRAQKSYGSWDIPYQPYPYPDGTGDAPTPPYKITCTDNDGKIEYHKMKYD